MALAFGLFICGCFSFYCFRNYWILVCFIFTCLLQFLLKTIFPQYIKFFSLIINALFINLYYLVVLYFYLLLIFSNSLVLSTFLCYSYFFGLRCSKHNWIVVIISLLWCFLVLGTSLIVSIDSCFSISLFFSKFLELSFWLIVFCVNLSSFYSLSLFHVQTDSCKCCYFFSQLQQLQLVLW